MSFYFSSSLLWSFSFSHSGPSHILIIILNHVVCYFPRLTTYTNSSHLCRVFKKSVRYHILFSRESDHKMVNNILSCVHPSVHGWTKYFHFVIKIEYLKWLLNHFWTPCKNIIQTSYHSRIKIQQEEVICRQSFYFKSQVDMSFNYRMSRSFCSIENN